MPYRMEIRVISARKLDIRREIAGSLKNGKRRTPIGNPGEIPVVLLPTQPFPVTNCRKEGHISRECRGERRNQGRKGNGGSGGGQMAEMAKSMAAMQEVLKKLVPESVFPYER